MYPLTLAIHSWLRWVVLVLGALALARAMTGGRRHGEWTPADARAGLWFVLVLDAQLLLGLAMYLGLSPMTQIAFQDFGAAMVNPVLRFWAVEHIFGMVAAVVLAHIGRFRIRRTADAADRHRVAAIFFGLAVAAMLVTIPWPGMPSARPFLRTL